jgi:flagellar biosynthetic protein FliR
MIAAPQDVVARMAGVLILGWARISPPMMMLPAFGGRHLRVEVRLALGAFCALLAWPQVSASYQAAGLAGAGPLLWILILAREVAIGVAVGFVASLAFHAAEAAGQLGDVLRGANAAAVLAPDAAGDRESPLGSLYLLLATVIFLEIGGPGRVVAAMTDSYLAIPLGLGQGTAGGMQQAALLVVLASAKLLASALALAAPLLVALLLAEVALAVLARVAPQAPIYFLGLPTKALLGVGVVLVGVGFLQGALARGFVGWLELMARTLASFRG